MPILAQPFTQNDEGDIESDSSWYLEFVEVEEGDDYQACLRKWNEKRAEYAASYEFGEPIGFWFILPKYEEVFIDIIEAFGEVSGDEPSDALNRALKSLVKSLSTKTVYRTKIDHIVALINEEIKVLHVEELAINNLYTEYKILCETDTDWVTDQAFTQSKVMKKIRKAIKELVGEKNLQSKSVLGIARNNNWVKIVFQLKNE